MSDHFVVQSLAIVQVINCLVVPSAYNALLANISKQAYTLNCYAMVARENFSHCLLICFAISQLIKSLLLLECVQLELLEFSLAHDVLHFTEVHPNILTLHQVFICVRAIPLCKSRCIPKLEEFLNFKCIFVRITCCVCFED